MLRDQPVRTKIRVQRAIMATVLFIVLLAFWWLVPIIAWLDGDVPIWQGSKEAYTCAVDTIMELYTDAITGRETVWPYE